MPCVISLRYGLSFSFTLLHKKEWYSSKDCSSSAETRIQGRSFIIKNIGKSCCTVGITMSMKSLDTAINPPEKSPERSPCCTICSGRTMQSIPSRISYSRRLMFSLHQPLRHTARQAAFKRVGYAVRGISFISSKIAKSLPIKSIIGK